MYKLRTQIHLFLTKITHRVAQQQIIMFFFPKTVFQMYWSESGESAMEYQLASMRYQYFADPAGFSYFYLVKCNAIENESILNLIFYLTEILCRVTEPAFRYLHTYMQINRIELK